MLEKLNQHMIKYWHVKYARLELFRKYFLFDLIQRFHVLYVHHAAKPGVNSDAHMIQLIVQRHTHTTLASSVTFYMFCFLIFLLHDLSKDFVGTV